MKIGRTALLPYFRPGDPQMGAAVAALDGVYSSKGLLKVLTSMEEHVAQPSQREALANLAGLSVRQLERLFRFHLSTTIGEHYLSLRLDKARRLFAETTISVTEASLACGFASVSHFSRKFRQRYGVAPSAMRSHSSPE